MLEKIVKLLATDPFMAHEIFFEKRHPQKSAPFHAAMLRDWYSADPKIVQAVFRGGAKSTIGEEAAALIPLLGLSKNFIIVGSSEPRAKERLEAIKHEYEYNEHIHQIFGNVEGPTWGATKIVLSNHSCIQALGWSQSMRGIKHYDWRPDFLWIDDPEDDEDVCTPEARLKVIKRLLSVVIPAVDAPNRRMRVTGSILDNSSLIPTLSSLPDWKARNYPVKYLDVHGQWQASWPDRKPLEEIDKLEDEYTRLGQYSIFEKEYMCKASVSETKKFNPSTFRSSPITRSYEPIHAVYDPARTTDPTKSAHTGKVVYSWYQNKLLIWESSGNFWSPSDIVTDIFKTNSLYSPISIGIEQDGLHEFIFQPIRHEQTKLGILIPITPLKAPRGKLEFISGLQPFFSAGEIIFVPDNHSHQELINQLTSFPSGKIDIPNALAYALSPQMKLGQPVFDNFSISHIDPSVHPIPNFPLTLAVNSESGITTAILIQIVRGQTRILDDWVAEGDPGTTLRDLCQYARHALAASHPSSPQSSSYTPFNLVAPPAHWRLYGTVGMRPAAKALPATLIKGQEVPSAREVARTALNTIAHAQPSLVLSPAAVWTRKAFLGGYRFDIDPRKLLTQKDPAPGIYRTLMDGLVSALTPAKLPLDMDATYAYTQTGARYITSRR